MISGSGKLVATTRESVIAVDLQAPICECIESTALGEALGEIKVNRVASLFLVF